MDAPTGVIVLAIAWVAVIWAIAGVVIFIKNLEGQDPKPWYKHILYGPIAWVLAIFYN